MQKKTVFISWSETGSMSHRLAEFLRGWLARVFKRVKPEVYVSSVDIGPGELWLADILKALRKSTCAILCLSRTNIRSPWIHFEAGAAARSFHRHLVCPLLIDLPPAEVPYPLSIFQSIPTTQEGLWRLLTSLNGCLHPRMSKSQLESTFDKESPELVAFLARLRAEQGKGFWRVLTRGMKREEHIQIVLSARWGVEYENGKPTRKHGHTVQVSYNEAATFFDLQHVLDETGHSPELVYGGIRDFKTGKVTTRGLRHGGTLLILGSKHANDICKRILSDKKLKDIPYRYGMIGKREKCIRVYQGDDGKYHKRAIASFPRARRGKGRAHRNRALSEDYGIILRATNPLNKAGSRKVLILGGNHGFGTESAIQFITDLAKCSALNHILRGHDFELLFEASVGIDQGLELGILKLCLLRKGKWVPLNRRQLDTLKEKCRGEWKDQQSQGKTCGPEKSPATWRHPIKGTDGGSDG
jgi:hypothetical protein